MGEIIQFNQYRAESKTVTNDDTALSKKDVHKVEQSVIRLKRRLKKWQRRKICL